MAHGLPHVGVIYSLMRLLPARLAIVAVKGDCAESAADQVPISGIGEISPSQVSEVKRSCVFDPISWKSLHHSFLCFGARDPDRGHTTGTLITFLNLLRSRQYIEKSKYYLFY